MTAPLRTSPGVALANSAAISVSNSTADTQLLTWTHPANSLQGSLTNFIGQAFVFDVVGNTDNASAATGPTFSVFLKVAPSGTTFAAASKVATVTWQAPNTTAKTNQPFWARFVATVRSLGTSGTIGFQGYGYSGMPTFAAGAFATSWTATPGAGTTVNTTIANTIYVGMAWNTASASNVGRADQIMGTVFGASAGGFG